MVFWSREGGGYIELDQPRRTRERTRRNRPRRGGIKRKWACAAWCLLACCPVGWSWLVLKKKERTRGPTGPAGMLIVPPHDTEAGSAPDFSTTNRFLYCQMCCLWPWHTRYCVKYVHFFFTLIKDVHLDISCICLAYDLTHKSFDDMKAQIIVTMLLVECVSK